MPEEYIIAHLVYKKEYEEILSTKSFKVVFIIRDPRDQLISRIEYIYKYPLAYPGLQSLSFDDLLLGLIGANALPEQTFNDLFTSHISYPHKPEHKAISNIFYFYSAFLPWSKSPICYTTSFEKLVGVHGGGDKAIQINELKRIAQHLGENVSQEHIEFVANNLFGGSSTFREGKIGAWKSRFTDEHKKAFKEIAGQLLIDLGYEKDFNW